jgi:drug/metabolite transporter (DMT)-like permease
MSTRDFALLMLVCLIWGGNYLVADWVFRPLAEGGAEIPPIFFAFVRFAGVLLALLPLALKIPRRWGLATAYGLAIGAFHFAFLYIGVSLAGPATTAVVFPVYLPLTTLLAVVMLGEEVRWRRGAGIALAAVGVVVLGYEPGGVMLSAGVLAVLGAAAAAAVASVLNRRLAGELQPMQSQAWSAAVSVIPLLLLSLATESGQIERAVAGGWGFVGAALITVLVVSIFAHSVFFFLLTRNPATVVTPLSLMASVFGLGFSVAFAGDRLTAVDGIGAAAILVGATLVALRPARKVALDTALETTAR